MIIDKQCYIKTLLSLLHEIILCIDDGNDSWVFTARELTFQPGGGGVSTYFLANGAVGGGG